MSSYPQFFEQVTGHAPYPYQARIGETSWPDVVDVPTGLGKTAAVIVGWLWRRLTEPGFPRRLVFCLPMRTLVRQTETCALGWIASASAEFERRGVAPPSVHALLGGDVDDIWDTWPDRSAILIGTQDMLLSRALNRGYAMSRYRWPIHFGLLNNDALWVLDETQLMGVAVETSAQLQAFRVRLGTTGVARTTWMSATLGRAQLQTVDHDTTRPGWSVEALREDDLMLERVRQRTAAPKRLARVPEIVVSSEDDRATARRLAEYVSEKHVDGTLTLVVLNRVSRAVSTYRALLELGRSRSNTALVHSRFRSGDREAHERVLHMNGDRIVVATQAIEAGVDVSATTLVTELAPWPSLVQRFGRCNRDGRAVDARVAWIELDESAARGAVALPYEPAELATARDLLSGMTDVGPESVAAVSYVPPRVVRPVVRRRDLLELFDTTPDLCGKDLDVSRFVRDGEDSDVIVFWRALDGAPGPEIQPSRDELCRVSLGAFAAWTRRKGATDGVFEWRSLEGRWEAAAPRPGGTYLIDRRLGGYSDEFGWTGDPKHGPTVLPIATVEPQDSYSGDRATETGRWIELHEHLIHVAEAADALATALDLAPEFASALGLAARWHDVGKAHSEFQLRLRPDDPTRIWAKSAGGGRRNRSAEGEPEFDAATSTAKPSRTRLRHELASALAWWQWADGRADRAIVAYLIASHHGKVRVSIRSMPDETRPEDPNVLYARGIWTGDRLPGDGLPPVAIPGGPTLNGVVLDLEPIRMGVGSWLEGMLALRDSPEFGPFRLAYLEAVVRAADARASAQEVP